MGVRVYFSRHLGGRPEHKVHVVGVGKLQSPGTTNDPEPGRRGRENGGPTRKRTGTLEIENSGELIKRVGGDIWGI